MHTQKNHFTALWILSGITRYQKGKPIWTLSGSGISWAICKSAPPHREITTPAPHRPDALHTTLPTASKHWRH